MGEIKSKASQNLNGSETLRIQERRDNVEKLINRMNMRSENVEGSAKMCSKNQSGSEVKRKLSFKEKLKKKLGGNERENSANNNHNNNNKNNNMNNNYSKCSSVIIDQVPWRSYELDRCETVDEKGAREHDDVDNANVAIKKKDSIDNIIDMIVSKSLKREETLNTINEGGERKQSLKRSKSYHGKESHKKLPKMTSRKEADVKPQKDSLINRLENLEKRAIMFEKGIGRVEDWLNKGCRSVSRQRSKCSAASEEFEKNMIEVLEENYRKEESLNELKTIERIKCFHRELKKDKLIAAPKADPIIRNSIEKIVFGDGKEKVKVHFISEYPLRNGFANDEGGSDRDSLVDKGWVIVENKPPKVGDDRTESDGSSKQVQSLVKSSVITSINLVMNGDDANKLDEAHVPGGKTYCQNCKKKCSGEVLRVQDKYFHISCFKCKACKNSLAQGGFFCKDGDYYCTNDYQRQFGTKCSHCGEYVEGEVVTALGNTYHQKCFTCARCRQVFPSGERVTYTGKEVLCQRCVQIPVRDTKSPARSPSGPSECAGCGEELKDGQALIALERQWHIWCFKCKTCDSVLHGEYMGKEGVPYCEKDYQKQFGVKCAYCSRFISGKVLQAGDNHHFHPTCARCSKCGDPFGDGEEMYLQGGAIWHPRCGPGPTENGTIINGSGMLENGHCTDTDGEMSGREGRDFDRMSSSAVSEMQFSLRSRTPSLNGSLGSPCNSLNRKYVYHRAGSPGIILREYKSNQQFPEDISRIYTYSYLTEEPSQGYLKRPIDPYDKPPTSPHFHRPSSSHSQRSGKILVKAGSRSGMKVMAESIRSETPRPKSPHMNNEEPIELAHFPDAKKPKPGEKSKIERDDFPAPPYPYTDPERRKRWSDSHKGASDEDEDEIDATDKESGDDKLKKEEEELSKIATGIGKVFLQNVKEREKLRQWKLQHLDPRNASRVPSANKEPAYRMRYQSPVNASPSRNMDHPRPWEEEEYMDRSSSYRSSVGRSVGAIPSYNATSSSRLGYVRSPGKASTLPTGRYTSGYCSDYGVGYNVSQPLKVCSCLFERKTVSSFVKFVRFAPDVPPPPKREPVVSALRHVPKPGYGLAPRSHTFSSTGGSVSNIGGDFSYSGFEKTHSTEFSSGKSDISGGSISEVDRRVLNADMPVSTTFQGGLRYSSYSPHLRRSLPTLSHMTNEPPKIYPYHLLVITNYRLPADVDRCNLERHLSDSEFEQKFQLSRAEFYRLPQWRRNDLKRRLKLF